MEHEFNTKIDRCPVCKLREELAEILGKPELNIGDGEERFFEGMGEEMKERGLARPEWHFHLDLRSGVVVDPQKEASILVGAEVPQYGFASDICIVCGCIYATSLVRTNLKKPAVVAQPNRAQRRRDARQGPGLSGPLSLS